MGTGQSGEHVTPDHPFRIGEWTVDPNGDTLARNGTEVRIEPLVMDVLCLLASHAGELVTREEFEREVWHGALVRYDSVTSAIIKLRKALNDDARNPSYIATIPKRGYRLIVAVEPLPAEIPPAGGSAAPKPRPGLLQPDGATPWWLWLVILATLLAAAVWMVSRDAPPALSPAATDVTPSIVVLPFENVSDDPQQQVFTDGITEDIITDLARLSNLMVIASSTSFTYKGRRVQPQEIGAELGVDYVLDGSIQRIGDEIRINTRLVDTKTGYQKWAARYDRRFDEVFSIQDELTNSIVHALGIELTTQEIARLAHTPTDNLKAYAIFQEGQRLAKISTEETNEQAQAAYREAIRFDPEYGRAYGALAFTMGHAYLRGWTNAPVETLDRALELARMAVTLDDSIPHTYWALGYVRMMRKEYEKAEQAVMQSLDISPNFADGYGLLALISNNLGQAERAIDLITKGMQLNPHYTWDYLYNLGRAYYTTGRHAEAIEVLERAVLRNANMIPPRLFLAASYVHLDRLDDAEWEIENIRILSSAVTITHLQGTMPISNPDHMHTFLADLRQAGLPE